MKCSGIVTVMQYIVWSVLLSACNSGSESGNKSKAPALVNEGMPKSDLERVLGEPDSIATGLSIYDVEAGQKKELERWYYPKRTVVLLDDTVMVANELVRKP